MEKHNSNCFPLQGRGRKTVGMECDCVYKSILFTVEHCAMLCYDVRDGGREETGVIKSRGSEATLPGSVSGNIIKELIMKLNSQMNQEQ